MSLLDKKQSGGFSQDTTFTIMNPVSIESRQDTSDVASKAIPTFPAPAVKVSKWQYLR